MDVLGTYDCEFINAAAYCAFLRNMEVAPANKKIVYRSYRYSHGKGALMAFGKRFFAMIYAFNIREGLAKIQYKNNFIFYI